jgi:four helix bundle protein
MKIDDLAVYVLAMRIGEKVWRVVEAWNYYEKDTVGKQLVKSADSIAANIAEGYGRYFFKENKQFCYYSRGSIIETKTWLIKSKNRKLMEEAVFNELIKDLENVHVKLNAYIKSIGQSHEH